VIIEAGRDQEASVWLAARGIDVVPPYVTLALSDGDAIRAVALYNNYQQDNIDLSVVTSGPVPLTRAHLRAIFDYPFNQLRVNRVSVRTSAASSEVRKHIRRLGFKPEGKHPKFFGPIAAMSYGMTRENCKWL
jgi:hypothetical protein